MNNIGFKTIKCDMIHKNGCKHVMKGRHIKDLEKQMREHEKKVHPSEFYKMNENDKQDIHEIMSILILN